MQKREEMLPITERNAINGDGCYDNYSRGREKGYVPFNQDDSSTMVFNFLCEECKRIFNAAIDVLMLRNAHRMNARCDNRSARTLAC